MESDERVETVVNSYLKKKNGQCRNELDLSKEMDERVNITKLLH